MPNLRTLALLILVPTYCFSSAQIVSDIFRLDIGYGILGTNNRTSTTQTTHSDGLHTERLRESKFQSMGKGLRITFTSSFKINEFLHLEGGFQYNYGLIRWSSFYHYPLDLNYENSTEQKMDGINFLSGILWNIPFEKFTLVSRLGLLNGIHNQVKETLITRNLENLQDYSKNTWIYEKGFAYGFYSSMGVQKSINKYLAFSMEIGFSSYLYRPAQKELILSEVSGTDVLPTLTYNQTHAVFLKNYNSTDINNFAKAQKFPLKFFPFGAISINAGIRIELFKTNQI